MIRTVTSLSRYHPFTNGCCALTINYSSPSPTSKFGRVSRGQNAIIQVRDITTTYRQTVL